MSTLIILLSISHDTEAASILELPPQDSNLFPCTTAPSTRTTFNILWSCWITIFICTWVSMHPNIPPPRQGMIQALSRRVTLMFWALIVPELILTWAVKQWLAARAIEKEFKQDHNWTRTHAHFLGMGGFTLVSPTQGKSQITTVGTPVIPSLTIPIKPIPPERNADWDLYWEQMERHWKDMIRYGEQRGQFWQEWEQIQSTCFQYSYSTSQVRKRKLQDLDREEYQRYERYGHALPDPISYLTEYPGTLSFHRFRDLVRKSTISFPDITTAEISDRSKGDFLSKGIATFQTTWFIIQCIARGAQGLAITELELVTLALASLNGLTYFFWWDKPLGVQEPVLVYFKGHVPVERNQDDAGLHSTFLALPQRLSSSFSVFRTSLTKFIEDRREEIELSNSSLPIIVINWFLYHPIAAVVTSLYAIIDSSDIPPQATHVPMFYATNVSWSNLDNHFIYYILPIIAIGFGGVHCIGWNFHFPTEVERILWRVSAVAITAIPLVTGLVWSLSQSRKLDNKVLLYPALALVVVYVLARLSLFVQALVSLRMTTNPGVYLDVDWAKYIPHIS